MMDLEIAPSLSVTLVIPTYNAGPLFKLVIQSIQNLSYPLDKVLVIDSSSSDGTEDLAASSGFQLITIPKSNFDHGGTRNFALSCVESDIVIFMTQDAILQGRDVLNKLLEPLATEPQVAAVYGRQLPHNNATALSSFARLENYPDDSYRTELSSEFPKGIRKASMSNSFAAYRCSALRKIGGFPEKLILGEDVYVAGKLLLANFHLAYTGDACVQHSHNYSLKEEFKRYFDIGVFHNKQQWLLETFGAPEKAGIEFAIGQTSFLIKRKQSYLIPYSILSLTLKYLGYRLGRVWKALPYWLCVRFSMHRDYWVKKSIHQDRKE